MQGPFDAPPAAARQGASPGLPPPPLLPARVRDAVLRPDPPPARLEQPRPDLYVAIVLGAAPLILGHLERVPPVGAPLFAALSAAVLIWSMPWRGEEPLAASEALYALAAPLTATAAAFGLLALAPQSAALGAAIAGSICAVAAASRELIARKRGSLAAQFDHIRRALDVVGRRLEDNARRSGGEIKPGEELVLEVGERSPADAVVVAGRASVEPWLDAPLRVSRQEGDALLAGAQVVDGALRAVVRWAGHDRAWARLTVDPARRADRHTSLARLAERLARTGALVAGLAGGLFALWSNRHPLLALGYACAAFAALGNVGMLEVARLYVSNGLHRLLLRGISFRSPAALDRAGRISTVVFCAEGTLLRGEFNVASIEPGHNVTDTELLAWLAGAYSGIPSALGAALLRSAHAHQIRPDATRSPSYLPGLGVSAVASTGQSLVIGTRALLLERRISVASAEARIAELESLGRTVLLVALDGRWVGLIALQDSPRPGAQAAVHRLLDAGIEPVLLSADARETCRALARPLGIENVRPEVLPEARAREIHHLAQTGSSVAVVAHGAADDGALAAAQLSINLDVGGGPLERWDVDVASGDVRDAAAAVALARQLHVETRTALMSALAPAIGASLLVLLGAPPWLAPLAGLLGSGFALQRLQGAAEAPLRPAPTDT